MTAWRLRLGKGSKDVKLVVKFAMAVALSVGLLSTLAQAEGEANGVWRLQDGRVTVRVGPCGSNLCGTVIALAQPLNKQGQPKTDHENPNPALRNRPVIGLQILSGMRPTGDNKWQGTIYNADDGKTYSSYMKLKGGGTMQVKGCIIGILCKTMNFQRLN
jgi:uncharacterized protein (DUF2147 family)